MARRAAAPTVNPANQAGRSAAQAIKKIPKALFWVFSVFVLIGLFLGTVFGFIGSFLNGLSDGTIPGFGTFFQLGFILGLGGSVILYLRFAGFEDMQESGRAFIGSLTIGICAAVAFSVFLPMFGGHGTLRSLFIGGIAIAAIMGIANIFLKDDYLRTVKWGALLAASAFVCLLAVEITDGKGFEIGWGGWGKSGGDSSPKTIRLNPLNTTETFSNLSGPLSNRFEASARAKSLRWTLEEGSSCGVVIINDTHRVRQCPEEKEIPSLRAAGVLRPYENMHTLQFEGVGMAGKVTAAW
ncbi:MAG: hypothetical protein RLY47_64 [Candidatus Parcubacteria bacterium]|jgi:hypothetical protein